MGWGTLARAHPAVPARRRAARGARPTSATSCTSSNPTWSQQMVLDFLGRCGMTTTILTHNRVQLALHTLRARRRRAAAAAARPRRAVPGGGPAVGRGVARAGARARLHRPRRVRRFPPVVATPPRSCSPTPTSPSPQLGEVTVVGRGLGAYIALMLAGARPTVVRGAVLCDGPGLWGGASPGRPRRACIVLEAGRTSARPVRAVRAVPRPAPRDYATLFARLAVEHSGLDEPITVAAHRPPAVARGRRRRGRRGRGNVRPAARCTLAL